MYFYKSSIACFGLFVLTGCQRLNTSQTAAAARPLHGSGNVYFVPIANFPPALVQPLVDFYRQKYKLTIEVLPALKLSSAAANPQRRQLISQQLIAQIQQTNAKQYNVPSSLIIGLTDVDMYSSDTPDWKYVFAQQEDHIAVVSSARLDPVSYGGVADNKLLQSRLQKMVSKKIGMMYYHLPQSDDRQSVMYRSIMGPDDLDNMGEDF